MPNQVLSLVLTFLTGLAATAAAQTLQMSAASLTDITATAFAGGLPTVVRQVPAGLPLPYVDLQAFANGTTGQGVATVRHVVRNDEREVDYEAHESTAIAGRGPLLASVGPHEVLLTLAPSAPMPVIVEISIQASSSHPTGTLPLCQVDVDNDGTYEFQGSVGTSRVSLRRNLDNQTFVRVRTQQAVAGDDNHYIDALLHVRVRRDLAFQTQALLAPCSLGQLSIDPTFAGTLRFAVAPVPSNVNGLGVLVLGAAMQPFALPTPQPCIGVPRPDAVMITPGDGIVRLFVPPQLRPLSVFVQSAVLAGSGEIMPSIAFDVRFQ